MPKTIYTERDIDDLARRGVKEIAVTDDVYLTDIARERAEKLGIQLSVSAAPGAPAPERQGRSCSNGWGSRSQTASDLRLLPSR